MTEFKGRVSNKTWVVVVVFTASISVSVGPLLLGYLCKGPAHFSRIGSEFYPTSPVESPEVMKILTDFAKTNQHRMQITTVLRAIAGSVLWALAWTMTLKRIRHYDGNWQKTTAYILAFLTTIGLLVIGYNLPSSK